MKKMLIALVGMSVMALFAADCDVNGNFAKLNKELPSGWLANRGEWNKPWGVGKVVDGSAAGVKAFQVVSQTKNTGYYFHVPFPVVAGDKLQFTVKVKGKGNCGIGAYYYSAGNQWSHSDVSWHKLSDKWTEIKVVLTVKDGKSKPVAAFRAMLESTAKSDVMFEDYKVVKL